MRSTIFTLAALAAASLTSAAVSAPDYPDCSVNCVEKAIGQTNCAMDDYYCQCTEGRQQILDSGVGCLCQSTCSTTELLSVLQEVNKLCKSALQAKGETYTAPDVGLEACAGGGSAGSSSSESGSSTTGGASTSATGTSTSSSSSSTDEDASSEQEEEDGSGDSEESGAEGLRKVYQGAVVIGALAVGVAIL
ncbi:hypothetical protein KC332_g2893 [Hortaea werneckii]|uniref:CFEM domain-containing protein n=1 Tax=Hortaea werneckii EXF-2000 TaxID=1157616 RepID=A0A1Z5TQZ6_HORWE|nr:hypothetical protein KC358_g18739 [Hortaea werneckii]OTA38446.1 hypothetical protein BTJ68_01684 [Hortaea werneckii EXF-2000]KAI6827149.1 hypothetical protein KC350_g8360 [Hortaea werneckii]KAI6917127.1 hypothetical protein KC341_g18711 [Hortaea werneckii]KAI6946407.1 hypothetical protein KC348_g3142 [Hortaea werneckii]